MSLGKALPLFHPELRKLPAAPSGNRIILRPFPPPNESEGGIVTPDEAKERPYAGTILAMGDQAAAKGWDADHRVGDEVWWAKHTGVIEQWQHIIEEGNAIDCKHDSVWELLCIPGDRMQLRQCRTCGAKKLSEPIIVANIDDILTNVTQQLRYERGDIRRARCVDTEGKTDYRIERIRHDGDTLEVNTSAAVEAAPILPKFTNNQTDTFLKERN